MRPWLLALLLLAPLAGGCGQTWLEPNVDTGPAGLYVRDIDPHYGPTAGGNTVTITGGGFEGTVSVGFGNAIVDATVLDSGTITVVAPEAGMEIEVDVLVRSSLGEITVEGGYTFTDSDLPDDTGGDVEGVGGVVEFSHLQTACTQCFGNSSPEVYAFAAFHDATSQTWTGWLPSPGTCVSNPSNTPPVSSFVDVGSYIHLTAGSNSLTLTRTTVGGDVQYDAGSLGDSDFQRNTAYDLEAADGGAWGPFTVVDAVTTGQMITSIAPVELLYMNAPAWLGGTCQRDCAFDAQLNRTGANISYGPYGGNGTFVVLMAMYDGRTGHYVGAELCRDYDNGSINLPASSLASYPSGTLVGVYLYRYLIQWTANPAAGSYIESVVSIGVLGTAMLR